MTDQRPGVVVLRCGPRWWQVMRRYRAWRAARALMAWRCTVNHQGPDGPDVPAADWLEALTPIRQQPREALSGDQDRS